MFFLFPQNFCVRKIDGESKGFQLDNPHRFCFSILDMYLDFMPNTLIFTQWQNLRILKKMLECLNIKSRKQFRKLLLTFFALKMKKTEKKVLSNLPCIAINFQQTQEQIYMNKMMVPFQRLEELSIENDKMSNCMHLFSLPFYY